VTPGISEGSEQMSEELGLQTEQQKVPHSQTHDVKIKKKKKLQKFTQG
jgi:hypothetical protein